MHRISKGIYIRFWQKIILGIGDFRYAVLDMTKNFSTNTQLFVFVKTGFRFYGKMQFYTSFGFLKKDFLSELFWFCTSANYR